MNNINEQQSFYDTIYEADDVWASEIASKERFKKEFKKFKDSNILSYSSFYFDDLEEHLAGKNILEIGFGRGDHSLFMAQFGAKVLAVEVSENSVISLKENAKRCDVADNVQALVCPDLSKLEAEAGSFDYIVGKVILHHLTHEEEEVCMRKSAYFLKPGGEARFFEPAINSRLIDDLRWIIPVKSRPSILNRKAFEKWKEEDPHPDRDNSAAHYKMVASKYFEEVTILPKEGLQRFARFFKNNTKNHFRVARIMESIESMIPAFIHSPIARSQVIICRRPIVLKL